MGSKSRGVKRAGLALVFVAAYWLLEASADSFFYGKGGLLQSLFPSDPSEIFMRLTASGLLAALVVATFMLLEQRREGKWSQKLLRTLSRAVESSPATVVITDREGLIEYVNLKFESLTGYTREEVIGHNPRLLKSGEMPPEIYKEMWQTITDGREWRGEFHNLKKDGESYWESASISPVQDPDGAITHFVAVKEDITEKRRAEQALKESEEKYRLLFSKEFDAVALLDIESMTILEANDAHLDLFGFTREELEHTDALSFYADREAGAAEWKKLAEVGSHHVPMLHMLRKDGTSFPAEIAAGTFTLRGRAVACLVIRDVTERIRWQQLMEQLSTTDPLTGSANRRIFDETLAREWARSIRSREPLSLIMADIDYFKDLNDRYGHREGDACLKRVAAELASLARRPADLVARYGGDEFAVILPATNRKGAEELADAMRVRVAGLRLRVGRDGGTGHMTISLGVATMVPHEHHNPSFLVDTADKALYKAKEDGRNRVEATEGAAAL